MIITINGSPIGSILVDPSRPTGMDRAWETIGEMMVRWAQTGFTHLFNQVTLYLPEIATLAIAICALIWMATGNTHKWLFTIGSIFWIAVIWRIIT